MTSPESATNNMAQTYLREFGEYALPAGFVKMPADEISVTSSRELIPGISCDVIKVSPYRQNARIIYNQYTKKGVLIDPGGDGDKILNVLKAREIDLQGIWLTHSHIDHCGAVWRIKQEYDAPLIGSNMRFERVMRRNIGLLKKIMNIDDDSIRACPRVDIPVKGGEKLKVGDLIFHVIHTPGHSPGHMCFYSTEAKVIITGDLVFERSVSTTRIPGASDKKMKKTLKMLLETIPSDTLSLAGHQNDIKLSEWPARVNPLIF